MNKPINLLEKQKDKKKVWRNYVNEELKTNYKKIFNLIDTYIFLKVPSFRYVYKWRFLQEKKLSLVSKGKKIMSKRQIQNFIMFYERLTKHMLKNFPKKTKFLINIDNNAKPTEIDRAK